MNSLESNIHKNERDSDGEEQNEDCEEEESDSENEGEDVPLVDSNGINRINYLSEEISIHFEQYFEERKKYEKEHSCKRKSNNGLIIDSKTLKKIKQNKKY